MKKLISLNTLRFLLLITSIVYLAWILSDVLWQFFTPKYKNQIEQITAVKQKNITLPTHIFGVEKKIVKKTYTKVEDTKLNVFLVGIINKRESPIAIIKLSPNAVDKIYKIGDKINSKTKIKDIANTFVIIDHNGKDEKLELKYKVNENFKHKTKNHNSNIQNLEEQAVKPKLKYNDKRKLRSYLAGVKTNPASALAIVRVEPNFISGLLEGFKIYPAKEAKLFNEIGFKAGDTIMQINDIKLDNLSQAFKVGRELSEQKTFNFVIMRGGVQQYIYLDIN